MLTLNGNILTLKGEIGNRDIEPFNYTGTIKKANSKIFENILLF